MKFNWTGLIFYFLVFYFVGDPLRELLMFGQTDVLDYEEGYKDILLTVSSLFIFFLNGLIAYASLYYFFPRKKWLICVLLILLGVSLPIGLRYLIQQKLFYSLFGFANYRLDISLLSYFRDNLYFAFRFTTFGVIYYLITFTFYKEKRERSLSMANQKMELSLLRSQINPHFLLNSLNNIYSLVFHKSEKSLDALDTLSDMLKYSLYETKEKVSVEEELAYTQQFIELSKMRVDYPLAIELEVDPQAKSTLIPQFIIMPLIENAVKHGNLKNPAWPLRISIRQEGEAVNIEVSNQKSGHQRDETGGIGLENIKKRLELIYGERHDCLIDETEDSFRVALRFPGL